MARGKFITFEGGEGTGKSTQARLLAERLRARGLAVVLTREPGGAPGAEAIRKLLVEGDPGRWDATTEALLHYAARRAHLTQTVWPALKRGEWVVSDRFADSTMAYQGIAMGLGREAIEALHALAVGDFAPDLTLVLDIPVDVGLARAGARGGAEDRYERMGAAFHQTLRAAFRDIAEAEPERCVLIDVQADIDAVAARVWEMVAAALDMVSPG
jgi:dTMP kinase